MKNSMRPIHPGETLREEFLVPLGMTASRLSIELQLPATKINEMLRERCRVNADIALRLARFFDTTPKFWLNLQTSFDLKQAEATLGDKIKNEIQPLKLPLKLGG
jgi:addiction module HigA family antidote